MTKPVITFVSKEANPITSDATWVRVDEVHEGDNWTTIVNGKGAFWENETKVPNENVVGVKRK